MTEHEVLLFMHSSTHYSWRCLTCDSGAGGFIWWDSAASHAAGHGRVTVASERAVLAEGRRRIAE